MRKIRTILVAVTMLTMANVMNAQIMTYAMMRDHARFLTDRMAFTLALRPDVIDAVYMINFDYIYGVNEYLDDMALGYTYAEYDDILYHRDLALRRLLTAAQWARYISYDYFYRPIVFANNGWRFNIYTYDTRHTYYHYGMPRHYHEYRGGRYFHPMRPAHRPHVGRPAPGRPHNNGVYGGRRDDMPRGGHGNAPRNHDNYRGGNQGGAPGHNNHGSVNNNHGGVNNNHGSVNNNRGGVNNNHGSVNNNRGGVNNNHGSVNNNRGGVNNNHGSVNNNHGSVNNNRGGVNNNRGGQGRGGNVGGNPNRGGGSNPHLIRTSSGPSRSSSPQGGAGRARGGRH